MTLVDKHNVQREISLGYGYEEREKKRAKRERDRERSVRHWMMVVVSFRSMPQTYEPTRQVKQEAKLEQRTDQFMISQINHKINTREFPMTLGTNEIKQQACPLPLSRKMETPQSFLAATPPSCGRLFHGGRSSGC
jgi:hypothetical protein